LRGADRKTVSTRMGGLHLLSHVSVVATPSIFALTRYRDNREKGTNDRHRWDTRVTLMGHAACAQTTARHLA
jgi:hypothetical protein